METEKLLKVADTHNCEYCNKTYHNRSSLWKHKQTCTANIELTRDKDIDDVPPPPVQINLSLVVELLKQNQEFKELIIEQSKQLAEQCNINNQQNTQLLEAVNDGKLANNTTNNNTMNIVILPYNETDVSHLKDRDYYNSISRCIMSVPKLIEKTHFDPNKPENHNIYISNTFK